MLRNLTRTLTAAAVLSVALLAVAPPAAAAAVTAPAEPRAATDSGGALSWLWAPLERLVAAVIAPEPPPLAPAGGENSGDVDEGPAIDPNG